MNWLFNHWFQPQPQYLTFTFCESLVYWVTTNYKPLASNTFRYLEAEERRTRWKKEYGTDGTVPRTKQYGPRKPISWVFFRTRILLSNSRDHAFSRAANFTGPKLGARGGTSDDLQAPSFSFVFSAYYHRGNSAFLEIKGILRNMPLLNLRLPGLLPRVECIAALMACIAMDKASLILGASHMLGIFVVVHTSWCDNSVMKFENFLLNLPWSY